MSVRNEIEHLQSIEKDKRTHVEPALAQLQEAGSWEHSKDQHWRETSKQ